MENCRMEPTRQGEVRQTGEIWDRMQRRNLKDEKCFDGELWIIKITYLVGENCVFTQKIPLKIIGCLKQGANEAR
jgi:hypothetical protein